MGIGRQRHRLPPLSRYGGPKGTKAAARERRTRRALRLIPTFYAG